jgi:hypothetical protein
MGERKEKGAIGNMGRKIEQEGEHEEPHDYPQNTP